MSNNVKKTLVVGPAWVGDMVMSQTLYQQLKQHNPEQEIHVLAPPWSRPLLERMPEVSHSIDLPIGHGQWQFSLRREIAATLRAEGYQHAYVLPNSWKSALIPFWANIPVRTGWRGEMRWGLLNDVRYLDKQQYPLMIERFMALGLERGETLTKPYPTPRLVVDAASLQAALNTFELTRGKPILALCPGAEYGPAKRWPETHYADVANHYLGLGWQVWVFGSKNDSPVAQRIQQLTQYRCQDLTGKTNLGQAIDLLSIAEAVVTNDSGLMHIAAALQRPLVAVYGSSDPYFTPPLHQQVKIVRLGLDCSPCFKRECPFGHAECLTQLKSALVLNALTEFVHE
jgi:heptosyltransferase-2